MPSTSRNQKKGAGIDPTQIQALERIAQRALAYCTHMIWEANHRAEAERTDPKVGGHPASCSSSVHLVTALHMVERYPSDYYCAKPHLAPMDHCLHYMMGLMRTPEGKWMAHDQMEVAMHNLRKFSQQGEPVFQSYHSELDPDCWRILPSGTVGIPPVCSAYLALAYDYAKDHGFEIKGKKHFWSLIGDSEFREGSLMEALPDIAERELGNITWIIDYNRQNLDGTRIPNERSLNGTDADRIERTALANGWEVIQVRHGRKREELFKRKGGRVFKNMLERGLSDYEFQALLWRRDPDLLRAELLERNTEIRHFLKEVKDEELLDSFQDLGGHDIVKVLQALQQAKENQDVPCMVVAHTVKGWGLESFAMPGNHSSLPSKEEVEAMLAKEGLTMEKPYDYFGNWDHEGAEIQFMINRGKDVRLAVDGSLQRRDANQKMVEERLAPTMPFPKDFGLNVDMVPYAHTQWAWGQIAGKLVRVGTRDELQAAGREVGRELTEDELKWAEVADLVLTMSPDVGTSTNINPAMDNKIYGPARNEDLESEYDFKERGRPALQAHMDAWTRHIRFEIAEANCMSAVGSFGCMGKFTGVPFMPMMTVYDFFIKRALDQLYYNLYWRASFILVGTPSGVTLSPEGAQHSWKSDIQIPSLVTWEPVFAKEMEWVIADAIRRHIEGDNEDREGVLIRAVTRGVRQKAFGERLRAQPRFIDKSREEVWDTTRAEFLQGGYRLIDYRGENDYTPGENVVSILAMGSLTTEAVNASDALREKGIYADVIVVSCIELLLGRFARRNDYHHLKRTLGLDGALHLVPQEATVLEPGDATLLAARNVPIVSVADGEEGLLDNAGSILGVRHEALAVRKFSKSGRPADIYDYQEIDAKAIFETCGRVLAENALASVRLSRHAWESLARTQLSDGSQLPDWKDLWPYQYPES